MVSLRYRALQWWLHRAGRATRDAEPNIPRMRRGLDRALKRLGAPARGVTRAAETIAGVPCIRCIPERPRGEGVIVYAHGGGYVLGSAAGYEVAASRLCQHLGRTLVIPDYRRAPEAPAPAAVDDLSGVAAALLDARDVPITLMGDSAGGGLALGVAQRLRDSRAATERHVAGLVLFSPWVDLRCETASMRTREAADPIVRPHWLRAFAAMYAGAKTLGDPAVSSGLGTMEGLPATLVEVGGREVMRDDALALREALVRAAVEVELWEDPEGIHVWQIYLPWLPEARESVARVRKFLDRIER